MNDSNFSGSIPEIYDSQLVPILFENYADDLARRVVRHDPAQVLELAAGSGVVTRALAPRLGEGAKYVATDLNQAMLDRAQRRQPGGGIEWHAADAMSLPFEDSSFDAVLCQFGVMFFPDRVAAFSETRRVLRSGGRFVFNSWGAIEQNEFSDSATATMIRLAPDDPPLFLARTPFGYSDASRIEADLSAAGFGDIRIEDVEFESRVEKADDFAFAQCYGSPLRLEIEGRGDLSLQQVREAIADDLAQKFGTGPIAGRMTARIVEAVAP